MDIVFSNARESKISQVEVERMEAQFIWKIRQGICNSRDEIAL